MVPRKVLSPPTYKRPNPSKKNITAFIIVLKKSFKAKIAYKHLFFLYLCWPNNFNDFMRK